MKQILNFVRIIGLAAIVLVLMPTEVWAAEGNIFTIIAQKMVSTVRDLRSIVYVVAGFGLIMFSFLAIFNKISFKHLGYIMISLSLLAVMMPFINYFSGAGLRDDVNYGNFISGGDASIVGSDVGDDKPCTPESCPKLDGVGGDIDLSGLEVDTGNFELNPSELNPSGLDLSDMDLSSVASPTGWDENGCRTNAEGKRECCQGKIKKGVCKKTALQKLKDLVKTGQAVVNAARSVEDGISSAYKAGKNASEMVGQVGDIIKGDGSIADKIGDIASTVNRGTSNIGTNINRTLGSAEDAMDYSSDVAKNVSTNYETNPDGKNKVSDALEHGGARDAIDSAKDRVNDGRKGASGYATTVESGASTAQQGKAVIDRIGKWFKKK